MIEIHLAVDGTDECEDCQRTHNGSTTIRITPDNAVLVDLRTENGKEGKHQELCGSQEDARFIAASNLLANAWGIVEKVLEVQPEAVLLDILGEKIERKFSTIVVDLRNLN